MKLKTALVALGAAALMVPVGGAVAAPGKSGEAKTERAGKGKGKAKNAVFKGLVSAVDVAGGTVTVDVTKTSKHGRRFDDTSVVFDVADVKKLGVRDGADEGTEATLADVAVGDKAHAQARVTKDSVAPLAARKFKVQYPEVEEEEAPAPAPAP